MWPQGWGCDSEIKLPGCIFVGGVIYFARLLLAGIPSVLRPGNDREPAPIYKETD